ncbi:galactose mutarotase [Ancylobacter sp. 6x-1]|uniref:Aldose 1-epimerase n=1 Tax=Ancylobacter crimeensis TaxID=2579147 RepID=A0ABT0D618_9HYPH|nr:aldose epimerase family protein [Ancylobacter crimeensis]MCK0195390.1 galactose mutarotase [Ancylobacter crimeensis]
MTLPPAVLLAAAAPASREVFGHLPDGTEVERIRLAGANGFEVAILTYGATIQALHVPDRNGRTADIVLGHDTLAPYLATRSFFGATIGRYANRIAGGAFTLDGATYPLACNDGANTLHGGVQGFDRRNWRVVAADAASVTLALTSPDGDEGFPGTLEVALTYRLTGPQELTLTFEAVTDAPTLVNLTHHGFFNLAGVETGGTVLDHVLTIPAESYLPVDAGAIPLDGPAPVAGTPFDFRSPHPIGERIHEADEQIRLGRGYDHNYCLADAPVPTPRLAARVEHPGSGRVMEILTDQPGVQFYSGNFLDETVAGKFGRLYRQSAAFCLEPQFWPDSPHRPSFPSARLDTGRRYSHTSVYRFSAT